MQNKSEYFYNDAVYESIVREAEVEITRMKEGQTIQRTEVEGDKEVYGLAEILKQQGETEQAIDVMTLLKYIEALQKQLGIMESGLQQLQKESGDRIGLSELLGQQERVTKCSNSIKNVKNRLREVSGQALVAFGSKGYQAMNHVLQHGIKDIKNVLVKVNNNLESVLAGYEKISMRIDSIGNELKQIGNSTSNIGRIITGKEKKDVSTEKVGVALTRVANAPIKKCIASIRKCMGHVNNAVDRLNESLEILNKKQEKKSLLQKLEDKKQQIDNRNENQKEALQKEGIVHNEHNNR